MGKKRTAIRRTAGARWLGRTVGVGVVAAICIGAGAGAADAKPVDPSDGQISAAQQAADAATTQMGQINAQLATAQAGLERAQGEANIALDRYEAKQQQYADGKAFCEAVHAAGGHALLNQVWTSEDVHVLYHADPSGDLVVDTVDANDGSEL